MRVAERRVVEHRFHEVLAVVERAVDGDGVHVVFLHGGHLATLHLADAALRIQNHHRDVAARLHAVDRGRARIAARGTDHRDALAARCEHVVKESSDELQRDVFERQRRAVEQLEQPAVLPQFAQRRHERITERRIRFATQPLECRRVDLIADERRDDLCGASGERGV